MALNSLFCADVPLSNYSLTHSQTVWRLVLRMHCINPFVTETFPLSTKTLLLSRRHVSFEYRGLYMGCSDVSEFERIYGQILMSPSCVYDRLFTWTRMVAFNGLIVWKTFIDICFSIKSKSLDIDSWLYEIPKNDLVGDMKLWPPFTFPNVYIRSGRHAGRPHLEKAESIQLCDFRVGQATTGAEAQFWLWQPWRNLRLFFPHPPSLPLPLFNEGLGYHHGKIVELKMFVGWF